MQKVISEKYIVNFHCTCIKPTLEYALQVFYHTLPKHFSHDIERFQKRSLTIIFRGQPYSESLQQSGLTSLFERREELCKTLFSKITSGSNHYIVLNINTSAHMNYHELRTLIASRTHLSNQCLAARIVSTFCKYNDSLYVHS